VTDPSDAASVQKLWENVDTYSPTLAEMLRNPPTEWESQWEDKEQQALMHYGADSICGPINVRWDINIDARKRGSLYSLVNRSFFPKDLKATTFLQFVRALLYIGISVEDLNDPLKLHRPHSHLVGAHSYKMAEVCAGMLIRTPALNNRPISEAGMGLHCEDPST